MLLELGGVKTRGGEERRRTGGKRNRRCGVSGKGKKAGVKKAGCWGEQRGGKQNDTERGWLGKKVNDYYRGEKKYQESEGGFGGKIFRGEGKGSKRKKHMGIGKRKNMGQQ